METGLELVEYKIYHKGQLVDSNTVPIRFLDGVLSVYKIPYNPDYYAEFAYNDNKLQCWIKTIEGEL
jgi:hypothetical protein